MTGNRVGQHWLNRGSVVGPVEVRRFAHTEQSLLSEAQLLRGRVYRDRGFLAESDLVNGADVCEWDCRAVHVGLYAASPPQLVATVRLIRGGPGQPVPVELEPFCVSPERTYGEISRYVVAPGWNGLGLVPGAWRELYRIAEDLAILDYYAEVEEFLLESLLAVGLPFEVMGRPRRAYGTDNYPVRLRIDTLVGDMMARNPVLAAFLCDANRPRTSWFHPDQLSMSAAELTALQRWWGAAGGVPPAVGARPGD